MKIMNEFDVGTMVFNDLGKIPNIGQILFLINCRLPTH